MRLWVLMLAAFMTHSPSSLHLDHNSPPSAQKLPPATVFRAMDGLDNFADELAAFGEGQTWLPAFA